MPKRTSEEQRMSLKELVDHYDSFLESLERKSEQTRRTYQRALREFLRWYPVDRHFHFTTRDVERYRRHLVRRKGLKEASVATYLTALRRFCAFLIDSGVIEDNPAEGVIGGRRPTEHSRAPLSDRQVDLLRAATDGDSVGDIRDRAVIEMMLDSGVTEHEIVAADVRDLALGSERVLTLRVRSKGRDAKDQRVTFGADAERALMRLLSWRSEAEEDEPLVPSLGNRSPGSRMTSRGLREAINRRLIDAGIKSEADRRISAFSLRHTAGLRLARDGANVEEIMERMRIAWAPTARQYLRMAGRAD